MPVDDHIEQAVHERADAVLEQVGISSQRATTASMSKPLPSRTVTIPRLRMNAETLDTVNCARRSAASCLVMFAA